MGFINWEDHQSLSASHKAIYRAVNANAAELQADASGLGYGVLPRRRCRNPAAQSDLEPIKIESGRFHRVRGPWPKSSSQSSSVIA